MATSNTLWQYSVLWSGRTFLLQPTDWGRSDAVSWPLKLNNKSQHGSCLELFSLMVDPGTWYPIVRNSRPQAEAVVYGCIMFQPAQKTPAASIEHVAKMLGNSIPQLRTQALQSRHWRHTVWFLYPHKLKQWLVLLSGTAFCSNLLCTKRAIHTGTASWATMVRQMSWPHGTCNLMEKIEELNI